ncbi:MAG: hypothetical protein FGF52_02825 [Candidatus Brockarchaeota archaeon]|nr:hypothetical protein [Candidatus Brockarchaeota archaeon]
MLSLDFLDGYGRRWAVETAFLTFKRHYGEYSMAKTWKASIYDMLINL